MDKTVHNLIAAGSVLIGIILCKAMFEQDVNMDYVYAVVSIDAIILFEFLLKRK